MDNSLGEKNNEKELLEIEKIRSELEKAYGELKLAENGKNTEANRQWRLDLKNHISFLKRKLEELENDKGILNKESKDLIQNKLERKVSREEFLSFYKEGFTKSIEVEDELRNEKVSFLKNIASLFSDEETNLSLQSQEEKYKENTDYDNLIKVYEKMRRNFLKLGYKEEILNTEITTRKETERFKDFREDFFDRVNSYLEQVNEQIDNEIENQQIFSREIEIILEEQKNIEMLENKTNGLEEKANKEKELRIKQIKATIFEDEQLEKEYAQRFKRFYSCKQKIQTYYIDENNEKQELIYETIKDYPEYEEDILFLNLEDYRRNLETVSKFRNSGDDIYALGEEFVYLLENQPDKQKAIEEYRRKIKEGEKYIETFNGKANNYKVEYKKYNNAVEPLKGMVPVKDLTLMQKVKSATLNMFGIIKNSQYKYDIENKISTPYNVSKEYNELARKDYYRKELGMSKLSSWLKAKNERWLFKERGKKTEEEITRLEILRTEEQIDRRTLKIKENLEKNKIKIEENQRKREANLKKMAAYNDVQNDILAEGDNGKVEYTVAEIARNAVLESVKKDAMCHDSKSRKKSEIQYKKVDSRLERTERL